MNRLLAFIFAFFITSCFQPQQPSPQPEARISGLVQQAEQTEQTEYEDAQEEGGAAVERGFSGVKEDGVYTSKKKVALYIHTYNRLPKNYITKAQAQALGWDNTKGNLHAVAPGKSIGGDRFGNYEGQLPKDKGRRYTECDIDYKKGKRNAKRIVFSNDGLIFFTKDHYKTFEQLY